MSSRPASQKAIEKLHNSVTLEVSLLPTSFILLILSNLNVSSSCFCLIHRLSFQGSRSPIVVKYADNDRERQNRRGQALGLPLGMLGMPVIGMRPGLVRQQPLSLLSDFFLIISLFLVSLFILHSCAYYCSHFLE